MFDRPPTPSTAQIMADRVVVRQWWAQSLFFVLPTEMAKKKGRGGLTCVQGVILPLSWNRGHLGGFLLFFFFSNRAQASTQRHKDKQRLSPPGRSKGKYSISPRPMVGLDRRLNPPGADCRTHAAKAIFPNIYLLIGQGGKAESRCLSLCRCVC